MNGSKRSVQIFARLAGADVNVLRNDVPTEKSWYTKIGTALLVPFVMGAAGVTAILHVVEQADSFEPWFLLAGVIWGTLVVLVDRVILSARYNVAIEGDSSKPNQWHWLPAFALGVVRIVLAVGISFVVSEPLIALMFSTEAIQQAEDEAQETFEESIEARKADIEGRKDSSITQLSTEVGEQLEATRTQIEKLQQAVVSAENTYTTQNAQCNAELDNGNGNPRGRGDGPVAQRICAPVEQLRADWLAVKAANDSQIEVLNSQLDKLNEPIERVISNAELEIAALPKQAEPIELGLWERIERANAIVNPIWRWSLAALMIVLDSLAVLGKMLGGKRAHDEILAHRSAVALAKVKSDEPLAFRLSQGNRVSTERRTSGDSAEWSEPSVGEPEAGLSHPTVAERGSISLGGRLILFTDDFAIERGFGRIQTARIADRMAGERIYEYGVVVKEPADRTNPRMVDALEQEVSILGRRYSDFRYAPQPVFWSVPDDHAHPTLVSEFFPRTSLNWWLWDRETARPRLDVPIWLILGWFQNIIDALNEIWAANLVHGDGKPENLLVVGPPDTSVGFQYPYLPRANGSLLICDFGSAGQPGTRPNSKTEGYAPPEYSTDSKRRSYLGDVFSFLGATGYWLTNLRDPVGDLDFDSEPEIGLLLKQWLDPIPSERVRVGAESESDGSAIAAGLRLQVDEVYRDLEWRGELDRLVHSRTNV